MILDPPPMRPGPKEPENNLRNLRKQSGRTKADIAAAAGLTISQYSKLEDRERPLRLEYILALAKAHGVAVNTIIAPGLGVSLIGTIHGDGLVKLNGGLGGQHEPPAIVPAPPEGAAASVALQVKGNAMATLAADGWYVHYNPAPQPADEAIGQLCVVDLAGELRIRRLYRGREYGKFDLVSPANAVESNVPVTAAHPITWIRVND
jgi:transcriptional regulator with XRE-family HTH domain